MKYNLLCFQTSGGVKIFFNKRDYQVSTSFNKFHEGKQKIEAIKSCKMNFNSVASSRPLTHGQIS